MNESQVPDFTDTQLRLLDALGNGTTLNQAATSLGISDRHARRLLAKVWAALGATNRNAGLVRASQRGLLADRHTQSCGGYPPVAPTA